MPIFKIGDCRHEQWALGNSEGLFSQSLSHVQRAK